MWDERAKAAIDRSRNGSTGSAIMAQLLAAANKELTGLLYKHDTSKLRKLVRDYLDQKDGLWILFDNLDKGWPAHGLTSDDVLIIRCLLDAVRKLERYLKSHDHDIESHGVVFLRNDIYELLLAHTSDRGKFTRLSIDWTDPELLREMLRRRLVSHNVKGDPDFEHIWSEICVSHIEGEESSAYMIDRCLMRPRNLIELLHFCRSHAVNLGHDRIELDDLIRGEESYSSSLLANIGYEIRDVFPGAGDVLYEFAGVRQHICSTEVDDILQKASMDNVAREKVKDHLLWFGFLGLVRKSGETEYIYNVKYDMKLLKALIAKSTTANPVFHINPAFWSALEIQR